MLQSPGAYNIGHLVDTLRAFGRGLDIVGPSNALVSEQVVVLVVLGSAKLVTTAYVKGAHGWTHQILLFRFVDTVYGLVIFLEDSGLVL